MNVFLSLKEACLWACLFIFIFGCNVGEKANTLVNEKDNNAISDYYHAQLDSSISALESLFKSNESDQWIANYQLGRKHFKIAEPLLSFYDKENYTSLNQPNFLKVHEDAPTDIKRVEAFGFQCIEEVLMEDHIDEVELHKQLKKTIQRLKLVQKNTGNRTLKKHHIIWAVRNQLVRIASVGISGFDAPMGNSLQECAYSYEMLLRIIRDQQANFINNKLLSAWEESLKASIIQLKNADFDSFNRFAFIKNDIHTQLSLLNQIASDLKVEYPFQLALNNQLENLFTDTTFNLSFFTDHHADYQFTPVRASLGKRLFNDPILSTDHSLSCASCHQKKRGFTDGMTVFPKQRRNSPTVSYAGLQRSFFYDSRAGSLEGQIVSVVKNENEFHTDLQSMVKRVLEDKSYDTLFQAAYGKVANDQNIRNAIANYIRSLAPFDSKFDQNMQGKRDDLSEAEILGFNLFVGKAQCGTCHFPPLFNGTVPPYFTESEMELIGVPEDSVSNQIDDDLGRYELFQTDERKFFFKTPTVRNINVTAPYMHNGIYDQLEQVVTFYNHGGGVGMGMDLEYQTLPADSLGLTPTEIDAIVAFMQTLDDEFLLENEKELIY